MSFSDWKHTAELMKGKNENGEHRRKATSVLWFILLLILILSDFLFSCLFVFSFLSRWNVPSFLFQILSDIISDLCLAGGHGLTTLPNQPYHEWHGSSKLDDIVLEIEVYSATCQQLREIYFKNPTFMLTKKQKTHYYTLLLYIITHKEKMNVINIWAPTRQG